MINFINRQIQWHERQLNHYLLSSIGNSPISYSDIKRRIRDEETAIKNLNSSLSMLKTFQSAKI